jgi:uncharacterized protein DUF5677
MRDHPSTKQIVKRIANLESYLNKLKVVPATQRLRSAVVLPLLSKALTLGRAICVLIDAGYPAEAFAISRTLLEILFSLRYITNKFTEQRAEKYVKYHARVKVEWMKITQKHFPEKAAKLPPLDPATVEIAKEFSNKSNWTGVRGQIKMMAIEEDDRELDEQGKGFRNEFDYDGFYFWTSQYVHATVAAIDGHACKRGEVFKVRIRKHLEKDCAADALFITAVSLCKVFVYACRSMNEAQPNAIQELYKMIRKFYRNSGRKISRPAAV